ncbi:MAG TPA: peptidylprolyl isomerase [Opitutaceae bacterium]|nr:peptidylprolyl isomerase [Opitutaceae bacterium]
MNLHRVLRAVASLLLAGAAARAAEPALPDGLYAEISTARGTMTCELYLRQAPLTVANFVGLAEGTLGPAPRKPFYDGLKFHRVVPGFVVQGGDPLGTGDGGPGYQLPDEFGRGLHLDAAGVLAMANAGPDTEGSQFFITLAPVDRLNYLHSVFGRVVRGQAALPQIREDDRMRVKILRLGAEAQAFRADDETLAKLVAQTPRYSGPPSPGPTAPFDDPDHLLPTDPPRADAFNYQLANFERATGLKVRARILRKPAAADATALPAVAKRYAEQLGVLDRGAMVVYFADPEQWALWIAEPLRPLFGPAGTEGFLPPLQAKAEAYTAEMAKSLPPRQSVSRGMKIKYRLDAVLDGLLLKLEPAAAGPSR